MAGNDDRREKVGGSNLGILELDFLFVVLLVPSITQRERERERERERWDVCETGFKKKTTKFCW